MPRRHRQQFVYVLLAILMVAVLGLAIAQSAHLHPMLPAVVVILVTALLLRSDQQQLTTLTTILPFRRLPGEEMITHFPMPPPVAFAA